ncbi:hypothetical protein PRIPAC_96711 [Pristionchus pacificus]|uniref:Uncharacterized protein n=1 Tax=Pristionchus pacificus TaxID=54126 RepID=A0A2A6D2N7_PRIPA|nr:hypothetical protein PRIPAC_96711 [Pristionchus pacificus]|eukprot:PDM84659.1 hypothetical protein PRIPAC_33682 [Pristionchus pacificus]
MDDTWRSREREAINAAARILPRQRLSISMDDRRRGEVCAPAKPSRIPLPRERSGSTPANRSLIIDKKSSSGKDSRLSMSTSDSDSRQSSSTRLSRISLTFSSIGDVQLSSTLSNSSEILNGDKLHSDYSITLSLTTLFEHIKLVTVIDKTWIAGWSRNMEKVMPGTLHVGDQIVNDREMETGVHSYIYGNAVPGAPMRVTIRKQPHARTYTLVKPIHPSKWNLGIMLHHGKNRIEAIEEDSIAYRRGVPAEVPSMKDPTKLTPAAITDVNGKRLGLWSRNDELLRVLESVRDGSEFTLTLQPYDFVKAVKLAMKAQTKLYKAYC